MSFKDNITDHLSNTLKESLDDYFRGDPAIGPAEEAELLRFVAALRRMAGYSIKTNGSHSELSALADSAEALEQQVKALSGRRALPAYHKVFDFSDVGHTYAYSPITGRANPIAPPVFTRIIDNRVICTVRFGDVYEGAPGCVHGGVIALAWDHVLAAATLIADARGPTAKLTIHYLKPTPLKSPLRFEAWLDRHEGKKLWIKGVCYATSEDGSENIVTEAEGLFIHTLIRDIDVTEEHMRQEIRR